MFIQSRNLTLLPDLFAVCRLDHDAPVPTWGATGTLVSITSTTDELSVVCPQNLVPDSVRCERGWQCLRVAGTMDFSMIGVVASLVTPLAEAGISVFVVSTFDTDYLLVKEVDLARAMAALRAVGHTIDELLSRNQCPTRIEGHEGQAMKISVTDQIHLSEFQPSDQAACVEHFKEKEIYARTLRIPFPYSEADFQTWLEIVERAAKQQGQPTNWAIRNEQGFLIGGCGFDGFQIGKSHQAEIGYWLAKPYWGRGIMTAVVRKVCEFAFAEFGLVKIMAHVFADNAVSAKVLEKCGFVQEGYLRKHHLKEGKFLDAKLFALVKE